VVSLRTYFIETWGCQMNVLDSQHLEGQLRARGLAPVATADNADVALLNTCAVREKAVQKVVSRLGELRQARERTGRPQVVGLCGCVAEQEGARLLARSNALAFVLGPGQMGQLGGALDAVAAGERPTVTGFEGSRDYDASVIARPPGGRQLVTAIHGCSQHCTFCVVPYTRGHEVSRALPEIVAEVRSVVAAGAREVTLLGQTINAYRCPASGADFGDLLAAAAEVPGLWRLQYLTSHPKFFTGKMIEKMLRVPRLGTYLHVPFQSGSDAVLRRMHRGYSCDEYVALIARLREALPEVSVSTDVIVGFPGESDDDFEHTLSVVERVRFSQLYGFVYSPRPRTPALKYGDRIPRDVARARIERLFAVQSAIQLELNQHLIGRTVEVLVDGPAKRGLTQWQGRGDDNRVINFPGWDGIRVGELATVKVVGATPHALIGEPEREAGRRQEAVLP
jgi:tRNA-2-methylthio-N6-dimethylallyladenosine synthase